MTLRCLLSVLALSLGSVACASSLVTVEPLRLTADVSEAVAGPFMTYWHDESGESDLAAAREAAGAGRFEPLVGVAPNRAFPFPKGSVWARFVIANEATSQRNWIIEFTDLHADVIELYSIGTNGAATVTRLGTSVPKSEQPFQYRNAITKVYLQKGEAREFFVRFVKYRTLDTSITVKTPLRFHDETVESTVIYAMYFAVTLAMLIYNFLLYLSLRYRSYIDYCLFMAAMVLAVASGTGHLPLALGSFAPKLAGLDAVFNSLPIALALVFSRRFLDTAKYLPRADRALAVAIKAAFLLCLAGFWAPPHLIDVLVDLTMFGTSITVISMAWMTWRRGHRPALYFLISWSGFLASVLYWVYSRNYRPEQLVYSQYLPMLGQTFEMLIISLGLGDHINGLVTGKREAEIKAEEGEKNRMLLRIISHDLANPVSVVQNYANVFAERPELVAKANDAWQKVRDAAEHQAAIIEHVRELDGLMSGKIKLELSVVELDPLLKGLETTFARQLAAKNLQLELTLAEEPIVVKADPASLELNVLNNILSNAIKFSEPGGMIEIAVKVSETRVTVVVRDHGIGIPADILASLFDAHRPTTRRGTAGEKGTGFGMPIVKYCVEQCGGTIEVASRERKTSTSEHGTTVTLHLARAKLRKAQRVA